jgi:hypothetical protein
MAGAGDRLVENAQLLAHRRHDGLDRLAVRLSVQGLRGDVVVQISADHGAVHHRVDERDPLLGERGEVGVGREETWSRENAIEISGYGLRFEQFYIAVAQHRHLAEGVNGGDLRPASRPLG